MNIQVNQLGYTPAMRKVAIMRGALDSKGVVIALIQRVRELKKDEFIGLDSYFTAKSRNQASP